MTVPRIIIDKDIPFIEGVLDDVANVSYLPSQKITRKAVSKADALVIRTTVKCDARLLEGTRVSFIASATIGHDHIDTGYCSDKGIEWTNAPGCNASAVNQYILSALLNLIRSTGTPPEVLTIGVVGVGHVGSRLAKTARTLGMKTLLNDPPRAREEGEKGFVSLEKIRTEADIVSLHVPLTAEGTDKTVGMIDREFFSGLKKQVWFMNTSRGAVVEEEALLEAINKDIVTQSVIDVWNNEPDIHLELLKKSTFGTPHIAGYSVEGKANGTAACVRAISKYFGLGLDRWFPKELPQPHEDHFGIDSTGKSETDILLEAVNETYNIESDSEVLKSDPDKFSEIRNNYSFRRELPYYSIHSGNINPQIHLKLKKLGFGII